MLIKVIDALIQISIKSKILKEFYTRVVLNTFIKGRKNFSTMEIMQGYRNKLQSYKILLFLNWITISFMNLY